MSNIKKGVIGLIIGAIGVVFGDIGTSPLYALGVVFGKVGYNLSINKTNVYGIISLILWSITLVVSVKFVTFIMKTDNEGEGGIIALITKIKSSTISSKYKWYVIVLGLIGVGLFYGDSTITPAISVLSAVGGLNIVSPSLSNYIIPITIVILTGLFLIQHYGTGFIGKLFGPVMLLWFVTISLGGISQIVARPEVLISLSPYTAVNFFITHLELGFLAMGAVVLAITGVEALYADLGHFGRPPIAKAWFYIVFPALLLCYMGEGSIILHNAHNASDPLLLLFPATLRIPVLILSTLATIIASQAVISSAFSLTKQVIQLNFLPKMKIKHTSTYQGGRIYLPIVNIILYLIVILLVVSFNSAAKLANAYGIAVSGTLLMDTLLYLIVLKRVVNSSLRRIVMLGILFLPIDLLFVAANLPKVIKGGWLPLLIGVIVFTVIRVWIKGQSIVDKERQAIEMPLERFVDLIDSTKPKLARIPGVAVYVGHHPDLTPLALLDTYNDLHELQQNVVIVNVNVTNLAHIREDKRIEIRQLSHNEGICHVILSYGFHDTINIYESLNYAAANKLLSIDFSDASYFISLNSLVLSRRKNMFRWSKYLYDFMSRNALSNGDYYKLPIDKTVEMSALIKL